MNKTMLETLLFVSVVLMAGKRVAYLAPQRIIFMGWTIEILSFIVALVGLSLLLWIIENNDKSAISISFAVFMVTLASVAAVLLSAGLLNKISFFLLVYSVFEVLIILLGLMVWNQLRRKMRDSVDQGSQI